MSYPEEFSNRNRRQRSGMDRFNGPVGTRVLSAFVWVSLGLLAMLTDGPLPGDKLWSVAILSGLTLAFGVWGFLHSGGPRITAAGAFTISVGVFVGYAGLWWCDYLGRAIPPRMALIVGSAYLATVAAFHLFWWTKRQLPDISSLGQEDSVQWPFIGGLLIAAVSLAADLIVPQFLVFYTESGAVLGILLMAVAMANGNNGLKSVIFPALILVTFMLLFIIVTFDGFGRLPVIALALSVGILLSQRGKTRAIKYLALLTAPLASVALTALRYWIQGGDLSSFAEKSGPDSDVGGLWTYLRVVEMGRQFDLAWGETFVSTLVAWVPRDLWSTKPFGLGFELTLLLEPQLAQYGHSLVSTVFGEFYYNFGWIGLPVLVLAIGPAINWLDDRLAYPNNFRRLGSPVLFIVLIAGVVGALPHLVWSGTHTFFARLMGFGLLWVLLWIANWGLSHSSRSSKTGV